MEVVARQSTRVMTTKFWKEPEGLLKSGVVPGGGGRPGPLRSS